MKTINVKDHVWQEMYHLKAELMAPDMNEVMKYLISLTKEEGENVHID